MKDKVKIFNFNKLSFEWLHQNEVVELDCLLDHSHMLDMTTHQLYDYIYTKTQATLAAIDDNPTHLTIVIDDDDIQPSEWIDTVALVSDIVGECLIIESKPDKEIRLSIPKQLEDNFLFGRVKMLNMINSKLVNSTIGISIIINGNKVEVI